MRYLWVVFLAACVNEAVVDDPEPTPVNVPVPLPVSEQPDPAPVKPPPVVEPPPVVTPQVKPVLPPACDVLSPRDSAVALYATPEAGETPFVTALAKATTSIDVMVYLMGTGAIYDTLLAAPGKNINTRVILDVSQIGTNQKYYDALVTAGVNVHWSSAAFQYMHAKVLVVDRKIAVLTTGNYSKKFSIEKERNFVAVLEDAQDLEDLNALIDADWGEAVPPLDCTRLLVSPLNAKDRLLAHIDSATSTLEIHSMQFADWSVRNAVKARKEAGVTVRVLLADPAWIDANAGAATWLKDLGVEVRWTKTPPVHTKAITVDGNKSYVGSINLSSTSLTKNREVGLVTDDAAAVYVVQNTFEKDWLNAIAF